VRVGLDFGGRINSNEEKESEDDDVIGDMKQKDKRGLDQKKKKKSV
jgi:hypothetical protein